MIRYYWEIFKIKNFRFFNLIIDHLIGFIEWLRPSYKIKIFPQKLGGRYYSYYEYKTIFESISTN